MRRSFGQAVVLAQVFVVCAIAQEYSFRYYGAVEGLQNLVVLSLAQDRAGYIWAGTEVGLYRYDGARFRLMGQAEGLPCSSEVHGLFAASDGALWANTCARIFRFDGKRFQAIPGTDTLLRGAQVMADGLGGKVLIATPTGLDEASRGVDGSFSTHSYPLPKALAGKPTHGILRYGARLWFGCDRELCMEEAGHISVFGREQGLPEDSWDGIQISPDGSVWVRSPTRVYRREPGHARFSRDKSKIASSGFWGALTLLRDGSIMIPTDQGLAIHTESGWGVVNRQRGLRTENTGAVLEDREGSVWIGLIGGGVARWIGRGVWESWKTSEGLPSDIVWNIRRDKKGALWVGTSLGLARLDGSGRSRTWTRKEGLGGDNVRWLAESSDGSIWAAMKPGGLARIDPVSGKIRRVGPKEGLPCDPDDIFADRHGRLWIPTACGLFLNNTPSVSSRVTRVETPEPFGNAAWKVIEDTHGTIWVTNRTTLWSLREKQWHPHPRTEGMLTDNPYVMALANDGSIWLRHRYDAGVDRLEVSADRIVRATAVVPAGSNAAQGTAFHGFDTFGNFWRGTTNGVSVLYAGTWTNFTTEDGLVSNDCDGEAFWAESDGDVWLGTSGGLAHYHPGNGRPPAALVADPIIARLEVIEPTRLLRAELSSLNYRAEQLVRFAYRLDNGPWTDSEGRNISIGGLGPGRHRLEVRGRIRDGPFSSGIATAEFRVKPMWTETWWARVLALGGVLLAIVQFVRWRLRAATQKQAELEAIVVARTANLSKANSSLNEKAHQLRISEDRLKNAERLAHVGHWDWDVKANQISWSEEVFRIFGQPLDYIPSYEDFLQRVAPQDRELVDRVVRNSLLEKSGFSLEFQIVRPTGDRRILKCVFEVLLDQEGNLVRRFGTIQDITDSKRAQDEAFARQKLETVGTLANGIAHDFNNLLGAVLAQVELALEELPGELPPEGELKAIRDVAMRGSEIVRELMIYAGKEGGVCGLVDVSQVVKDMLVLLSVSVSKHATLVTELDDQLPAVRANAAQISQLVMNLVTNASEAIVDQNGTIRVTTLRVTARHDSKEMDDLAEGDYLQLEVSDTGRGMEPETRARVFEPFFSTKSAGRGLGLAVVDGIVRALGGAIHLASEPGHGTTVKVLLPGAATTSATKPAKPSLTAEASRPLWVATILVVEDEDSLRQAASKLLRKHGFSVIHARDGSVALYEIRAQLNPIDVLLLDVTLPGTPSREVLSEARRLRPEIRVIATSAYTEETTAASLAGITERFIRKPYRFADLMDSIQAVLS
jgi:PAS domain S-box-containing protein